MSDLEATPTKDEDAKDEPLKEELEIDASHVRDIGKEAIWSLSTAKPGNGIDQVRDDNVSNYREKCFVTILSISIH